jgi:general secretion pathway protein D
MPWLNKLASPGLSRSKFVEITQNNLKELGFDWLLGPFSLGGNSGKVFGSGGSSGTGAAVNQADYPSSINGQFPVTAGNRSGNLAITGNAIDALLLGTGAGQVLAPGIFGLSGVMTNPQFQVVIRALNQKKGIDLLSAPRVTTKSGQRAVIEIVREFRYPTQFQPPQIPQTVGNTSGQGTGAVSVPVTPTTPTAFETRNTGVTLEVEPVVGPDGVTIDLNLVPQVVEFEGFINYGSPILASTTSIFDPVLKVFFTPPTSIITPNVINQPIFSTRKVTTSVSVYDGSTVVLGGLMREDVQKTEDRTPIIGDIPLVGRLFRTNSDQHIKRNLVIFVTAQMVTPAGTPLNSSAEEEELIQPPQLPEVPMYKK